MRARRCAIGRFVVRIGSIDVSDLAGPTPADLVKLMMRAMNKIPNIKMRKLAWYMNRTTKQWLDIQRTPRRLGRGHHQQHQHPPHARRE